MSAQGVNRTLWPASAGARATAADSLGFPAPRGPVQMVFAASSVERGAAGGRGGRAGRRLLQAGRGGAAAVPGGRGGDNPVGEGAALGTLGVQGGLGALRALGGGAGQGAGRFGPVLAGGPDGAEFPGVLLASGFQRGGGLRRGAGGGGAPPCGGIACGLRVPGPPR